MKKTLPLALLLALSSPSHASPDEGRWTVSDRTFVRPDGSPPSCGRASRRSLARRASSPLSIDGPRLTWAGMTGEMAELPDESWGWGRRRFLRWIVRPRFDTDTRQVARVEDYDVWVHYIRHDDGTVSMTAIVLRSEVDVGINSSVPDVCFGDGCPVRIPFGQPVDLRTICQDAVGGVVW